MKRGVTILTTLLAVITLMAAPGDKPAKMTVKEGLQPFNDLIGGWKGVGEPEGSLEEKQKGFWKENVSFGWQFKGDEAWITARFQNGKHFHSGILRYLPDKNRYQFTVVPRDGKPDQTLLFEGEMKNRSLVLERVDDATRETQRITIDVLGEIRFVYRYDVRPPNRTLFSKVFRVGATREGESLATGEKRPECVVTGGLGTSTVSHKGQTYYVCCSGCRDYFVENPDKCIKEYQERKAREKKGE
jgi:hypothetical protein